MMPQMHAETLRSKESCQSHPIELAEMSAATLSRLIGHIQVGWKRCYAIECHEFWQLKSSGQEKRSSQIVQLWNMAVS